MAPDLFVRRARPTDAAAISRLNNTFADDGQMLTRSPDTIALAIDDYVVVQDATGALLGCGALKEYSPSVAEVAAIAVSKESRFGPPATRTGTGQPCTTSRKVSALPE